MTSISMPIWFIRPIAINLFHDKYVIQHDYVKWPWFFSFARGRNWSLFTLGIPVRHISLILKVNQCRIYRLDSLCCTVRKYLAVREYLAVKYTGCSKIGHCIFQVPNQCIFFAKVRFASIHLYWQNQEYIHLLSCNLTRLILQCVLQMPIV